MWHIYNIDIITTPAPYYPYTLLPLLPYGVVGYMGSKLMMIYKKILFDEEKVMEWVFLKYINI
jgi:hypothetical protein